MADFDTKLTRIGVFYDGNYFLHVSNYYNYEHSRKARLSIAGLHEFIRSQVAQYEGTDVRLCQVVDAHYFRGRLSAHEADETNKIFSERIFDDILMNEGVVTHYLPLRSKDGRHEEKGIDVWLALEAFELAIYKRFNVVVLIACDGDYVSLIRKLNTLGTRVMVLGWDFEYTDERTGKLQKTTTSLDLLKEVTYPISMQELIDNKVKKNESVINNLFVFREANAVSRFTTKVPPGEGTGNGLHQSTIHNLKNGYGFIHFPPNNLFFHWTSVQEGDFNELREGDPVEFHIARGDKGQDIAIDVKKWEAGSKPKD
ncbi:MAG: NYN domain-containing protein [Ferruginibacter sp.]|nr:NYN domain-containing protein [Cytophagales bacterium]